MGIIELLLVAVGLSMDAFAVSIGKGLAMRRLSWGQAVVIAAFFGGFQALMPALGWLAGAQFEQFVQAVAGWIAFGLLGFIGAKMIWDAVRDGGNAGGEVAEGSDEGAGGGALRLDVRELFALAIATSIDAFAAGVAFALVEVDIVFSVAVIGATTFALSLVGVAVGHAFGSRWERPSTIFGGCVLIAIGLKILLGL